MFRTDARQAKCVQGLVHPPRRETFHPRVQGINRNGACPQRIVATVSQQRCRNNAIRADLAEFGGRCGRWARPYSYGGYYNPYTYGGYYRPYSYGGYYRPY
jgi:hypothetical protein